MTAPIYTLTEIDAAEARAEAATQGPWNEVRQINGDCRVDGNDEDPLMNMRQGQDEQWKNAWFVAHARTDVPRLAATARTAIEQRDEAIEYARHKRECPRGMYRWNDETQQHDIPSGGCTCGLDDFLATVAQKGGA